MKYIPLTKGALAIVDDDDYEGLSKFKWYLHNGGYAARNANTRRQNGTKKHDTILMHQQIMGGKFVDHENLNKLDNQKHNLRPATKNQNGYNTPLRKDNTSGYKGVHWNKQHQKWAAKLKVDGKPKHIGLFGSPEQAAAARNEAALRLHGEYAR